MLWILINKKLSAPNYTRKRHIVTCLLLAQNRWNSLNWRIKPISAQIENLLWGLYSRSVVMILFLMFLCNDTDVMVKENKCGPKINKRIESFLLNITFYSTVSQYVVRTLRFWIEMCALLFPRRCLRDSPIPLSSGCLYSFQACCSQTYKSEYSCDYLAWFSVWRSGVILCQQCTWLPWSGVKLILP